MKFYLSSTFPACEVLLFYPRITLLFCIGNVSQNLISILLFETKVIKRNIQTRLVPRVISTEKSNSNLLQTKSFSIAFQHNPN